MKMKKIRSITALLLSCIFLAACSGQKDSGESKWKGIQAGMDDLSAITDRTEYYDIVAEQEPIFQWEPDKESSPMSMKYSTFIGTQFYQGEPVQFWTVYIFEGESIVYDLYLYRSDGSREILLQKVDLPQGCYLDQKGNLYFWRKSGEIIYPDREPETTDPFLRKYSPSGELLYEKQFDYGYDIQEIRQTADGRVYLFISGRGIEELGTRRLAELDPATGNVTELSAVSLSKEASQPHTGIWGEQLLTFKFDVLLGNEITAINVKDGSETCILSFQGTSYVTPTGFSLQDFQVLEDESLEILWTASNGSKSLWERLRMEKVERTPIVLRGMYITGWIAARINDFNRQSETYHVVLEDCGQGNDVEDFARLTSIQIASGKGPDIIECGLMKDYISGMMEKGALEDLRPYMERNGILKEDYFPFTFGTWRDKDSIYSVSPASPGLGGFCIDSAVLGGTGEPDIETLVNALLAMQQEAVFLKGYDSQKLLVFLLEATDTLWGMVDWEKGNCNFGGELFAKILDVSKRYGDYGGLGEVNYIAERRSFYDVFEFDSRADREREGKVICGVMFDDGCHAAVTSYSTLAVNVNSPNKEGAWEFISFLLGDEAQFVRNLGSGIPVSRKAFDAWLEMQKDRVADGRQINKMLWRKSADGSTSITDIIVYTEADITEEVIAEYIETLEDARPYPIRTVPILNIISEEAADYFNGSKSAAEVARLVTNRVQTYLDEGH